MRDQCYIKVRQTQVVLDAGPFRFSGLKIDENNWLFVFAALLQVIGGGGVLMVFFVGGDVCARQEKTKRQARSSSQALWFAPSLMVRPVVLHAECPLFPQFQSILVSCKNAKDLACAPSAGLAIVRIFSLASLALCSKGSRKQRPKAVVLGYISAVLPRHAEKPERAHTHATLSFENPATKTKKLQHAE